MSNYTRTIHFETTFDGDKVKGDLRRLKRPDTVTIMPLIGKPDAEGKFKIEDMGDQMVLMNAMSDLLTDPEKKYIVNFSGLVIEGKELIMQNGKHLEEDTELFDCVFNDAYFMPLLTEITTKLMEGSFLKEEERKKSEEPQENISVVPPTLKASS